MDTIASGKSLAQTGWLHSRRWDLLFVSLSVILVVVPYLTYLSLLQFSSLLTPLIGWLGKTAQDVSRNLVNGLVALLVGGPHMYATFSRTALDHDFAHTHRAFLWSSLLIPLVVIALALFDLSLLLAVFFFWASIHVLHQIIYIAELYNNRSTAGQTRLARFADYAVILTCLYPLAAWRMSVGDFRIGPVDISAKVADLIGLVGLRPGPWMALLAGAAFALSLVLWLVETVQQIRRGAAHWPKILFISLAIAASFFVPVLGNLDTAFQGMNMWHSLQYLGLTWLLNHMRQQRGELSRSPLINNLSSPGAARRYYLFNVGLTLADMVLAAVIYMALYLNGISGEHAFQYAYYIAVLSFLWMHYYHDHFLFAQSKAIRI